MKPTPPPPRRALEELHAHIDARVATIRVAHADWLCGKGCDGCCRRLADLPRLCAAEWELLRDGLTGLPAQQLSAIGERLAALGRSPSAPVTCPLLDVTSGACPVYAQRPVACRSYGFYVQRERGLYCSEIEAQVASGDLSEIVWGNHDAIDQELAALGDTRSLSDWFALWQGGETDGCGAAFLMKNCFAEPTVGDSP